MRSFKLILLNLTLPCLLLLCTTFSPVATIKPKLHTIEISQMQFKPATLIVKKGDTVVFKNKDLVTHDATENSGKVWKSPDLASGDNWRLTVTQSADYYCSYHPVMKGKIVAR